MTACENPDNILYMLIWQNKQYQGILNRLEIVEHAITLRPGHKVLPVSLLLENLPSGTFNTHVPIVFDDGEKWIARVCRRDLDSKPLSFERHLIQAEIDVMRWLGPKEGIPVPAVMSSILGKSPVRSFKAHGFYVTPQLRFSLMPQLMANRITTSWK